MNATRKLTSWEWEALGARYNLADGHAAPLDPGPGEYELHKLYCESLASDQREAEEAFRKAFFMSARQVTALHRGVTILTPSASMSIEIVAHVLRTRGSTVLLQHPTFDNIFDILHRVGVGCVPVDDISALPALSSLGDSSVFLVAPNNPTGEELEPSLLQSLANRCAATRSILVIDASFRFFSRLEPYDQYELLEQSGCSYMVIEDTGKTWALNDLKVSPLTVSADLAPAVRAVSNDMFLNTSRFALALAHWAITKDVERARIASVEAVADNRRLLRASLDEIGWRLTDDTSKISVAWVALPGGQSSRSACDHLAEDSIVLLPGGPFYWADPQQGDGFVRIALCRTHSDFAAAVRALVESWHRVV